MVSRYVDDDVMAGIASPSLPDLDDSQQIQYVQVKGHAGQTISHVVGA